MKNNDYLWLNGQYVLIQDAKVSVLSHGLHYGSSVFEGIRSYKTPQGTAIFRLKEHIDRLYYSANVYRMHIPWQKHQIMDICKQLIIKNNLTNAYLRPLVFFGDVGLGVHVKPYTPAEVMISTKVWDHYLESDSAETGVAIGISSWNRLAPNTIPTGVKAGGNYLSSQLIAEEARRHGYNEGVALNTQGFVSEGSGQNLFIIKNNILYTPPETASILPGITRDTIIFIAQQLGYQVIEKDIAREFLYQADEMFFCGTAVEIIPIISIDGFSVLDGKVGHITKILQKNYFDIFNLKTENTIQWLDFCNTND